MQEGNLTRVHHRLKNRETIISIWHHQIKKKKTTVSTFTSICRCL